MIRSLADSQGATIWRRNKKNGLRLENGLIKGERSIVAEAPEKLKNMNDHLKDFINLHLVYI